MEFTSRAGGKLQAALDAFDVDVKNKIVADFGSSTGGFVDCLLQNGAKKVFSIDTAYGELAWKLRNDERVVVLERTNAMHVALAEKVDLITIDTGWTKQSKIIPNAISNLKKEGKIITLIKPHYEADKKDLTKGKLREEKIDEVLEKVEKDIAALGLKIKGIIESPIVGGKGGNKEFVALLSL